jgi:shikimate dehydrogenase
MTESVDSNGVSFRITSKTKYILSTSTRISSLKRYQKLLQQLLGLDIVYLPFHTGDVSNSVIDPQCFAYALKGMPSIGGAISKDIKQTIVPYCDELDETAKQVASVNTVIVTENRKLIGYNTDAFGFRVAIEQGIKNSLIVVETAVCYGYGGVASVVVNILKNMGIKVYLCGRNLSSCQTKAQELQCEIWSQEISESYDLFVNATPASESPLSEAANFLESILTVRMVFDHEMPGKYLKEYCHEKGIFHISGYEMYYPQMELQWALFLNGFVDPKQLPELIKLANQS